MEKYYTNKNDAMEVLEKYGVAIIPSLLTEEDCGIMLSKMWDFFEEITVNMKTPIQRDDPKTWNTLLDLMPMHGMLFQHWGVGQSKFAWWLRQHPKVLEVFAKMWKTREDELLVSFDGASFQAPPDRKGNTTPNRGWGGREHWYHSDQSLKRPDRECIQGWVTAKTVGEGDATLAVLEGSHKFHREIAASYPDLVGSKDWVRYNDEVVKMFTNRGCTEVRVTCPPGSLVLWDSRTAHYGASPLRNRTEPNFRAICYVCYLPRSKSDPKKIKRKREVFEEGRTTSHWPNKVKLFPKKPRSYGNVYPNVTEASKAELSPIGRKLIGFD